MATTGLSSRKKANLGGPMTLLSGAICEWFLIFLLFVDATFSYILRRFAEYCELPTPCIFCTRIDAPSGKRKFEYYNALLCKSHAEEISALVSCHALGKLTDVREMSEERVMPVHDKLKSGSYIVGKLGTDIEKHSSQRLILHKKILPNPSGPRICPSCNSSWGAKLNAQELFKSTPVGLGASKANVKPRLSRVRANTRFSRKNSFKKLSGLLEETAIPQSEGKSLSEALSEVGYSELKVTSDSESEVNFYGEEESVIAVKGRNDDRNLEHVSHYVDGTLLRSISDDPVSEKHSNQNFADVTSLLDQHMQLETHKPIPTHGLEELYWEKPHPITNISGDPSNESGDTSTILKPQPHMESVIMPDELIPLMNTPPRSDDKDQETLKSHDEDDTTLAQQRINSTVFTDDGVPFISNVISSTNSSAITGEGKEASTTSVKQPSASGSTKFENIESVIQKSAPEQDDSQIVGECSSELNHVLALASLETKDSSLKLAERVSIPSGSIVLENVKSSIQQSTPEQNDSQIVGESISELNHVLALASLETKDSSLKLAERVSIPGGSTINENVKSVDQQSAPEQDDSLNIGEPVTYLNHVNALAILETKDSSLKLAERLSIPSGSTVLENVKSAIQQSAPEQDDSQNVGESSSELNHVLALASLETKDSSLKLAERVSIPSGSIVLENVKSSIQQPAPEQNDSQIVGESSSELNHVLALASLERKDSSLKLAERVSIPSGSTVFENVKSVIQQSALDKSENIDDPSYNENHVQTLPSLERNDSSLKFADRVSIIDVEGECSIDMLKSQIEHDKKCMNDLYKELEEERNASTIAANQAMAMITRLQEEKAQLHMEALQYLRMMDEQAEYDMEALQKANDDLTEKEKEIQDLEYELEFYRNNFHEGLSVPDPHEESISTMAKNTADDSFVRHNESSMCESSSPVSSKMGMAAEVSGNSKSSMSNLNEEKLYLTEYLKQLERRIHDVSCTKPSTDFETKNLEERLNAYEADLEFIKHSLRAVHNGNDGLGYIQKIIDQLQELRNIEFKKRCLSIP